MGLLVLPDKLPVMKAAVAARTFDQTLKYFSSEIFSSVRKKY